MALISRPSSSSCYHCILVVFLCFLDLTSAFTFLSDGIFHSSGASTRTLLQAEKNCSVDFDHANYTGLNSECKGPDYPPARCCEAFKQFACPYADEINDENNDCAEAMFHSIYINGRFPPGLFADECRRDENGLDCSSVLSASETVNATVKSTAHVLSANRATLLVAAVSVVSMFQIV